MILTKKDFSHAVERLVESSNLSWIEATLEVIKDKEIDPESVAPLLTNPLREKIEGEALEYNLIKGSGNKLPL